MGKYQGTAGRLASSALFCAAATVSLSSAPALAGEDILYAPVPEWTGELALDPDADGSNALVLFDVQARLEGGTVTTFIDTAARIASPESLAANGTAMANWYPDKGDLTVHRLSILRGDEVVDVLAGSEAFEVLRREQGLENRLLDGVRTATMPVPGLRVGDTVRFSYSTTLDDQALGDQMQATLPLITEPVTASEARAVVSWPTSGDIAWKAGPDVEATTREQDGYRYVTVSLPLVDRPEMPGDAPSRFTRPPVLQATSFGDWAQVSALMAPLYATEGTIATNGAISRKIGQITSDHSDPLARAAAALRVVQEDISYLMNGLDGGNYLPQTPAETWEKRYGDCKAKTLLLLAMLHEMDIAAEPVMVNSAIGDAVPELLPMAAAFNHIAVRATIDGTDYWLDGTMTGTRLATIANTPAFGHVLPVRAGGADLMVLEGRMPALPLTDIEIRMDQSAGVDLPMLVDVATVIRGPYAGQWRTLVDNADEETLDSFVSEYAARTAGMDNLPVYEQSLDYDADSGTFRLFARGLAKTGFTAERGISRMKISQLPSENFSFDANRARPKWREIPVQTSGPDFLRTKLVVVLPTGNGEYDLKGARAFDTTVAGSRLTRETQFENGLVTVTETARSRAIQVPANAIAPEKAKASRLGGGGLTVEAPEGVVRSWEYGADDARLKPIEEAYAKLIAKDPDEVGFYVGRASFYSGTGNFSRAVEDLDAIIALRPEEAFYDTRAWAHMQQGDLAAMRADREAAFELEPQYANALKLADAMTYSGEWQAALDLIEPYADIEDGRIAIQQAKADLLAFSGDKAAGLAIIEELLAEEPGAPHLLNSSCWYRARFDVGTDVMADHCDRAVESHGTPSAVLDSRGLARFRAGDFDAAIADFDAALALAPGQHQTLYLRGLAKVAKGDRNGRRDIADALRFRPSIAAVYERYGLTAP